MLLHSCPDTVHRVLLRKTQTSTPLIKGRPRSEKPSVRHDPCCSGLQVQGTAISPAARKFYDLVVLVLLYLESLCLSTVLSFRTFIKPFIPAASFSLFLLPALPALLFPVSSVPADFGKIQTACYCTPLSAPLLSVPLDD